MCSSVRLLVHSYRNSGFGREGRQSTDADQRIDRIQVSVYKHKQAERKRGVRKGRTIDRPGSIINWPEMMKWTLLESCIGRKQRILPCEQQRVKSVSVAELGRSVFCNNVEGRASHGKNGRSRPFSLLLPLFGFVKERNEEESEDRLCA